MLPVVSSGRLRRLIRDKAVLVFLPTRFLEVSGGNYEEGVSAIFPGDDSAVRVSSTPVDCSVS